VKEDPGVYVLEPLHPIGCYDHSCDNLLHTYMYIYVCRGVCAEQFAIDKLFYFLKTLNIYCSKNYGDECS